MANAFWVLLLLPSFLNPDWRSSQYEQQFTFPAPSEETVEKLESNGVTREDIIRITETWNDILKMENEVLIDSMWTCYGLIQNGTSSLDEFRSCESLVYSIRNHEASVIVENSEPLSIIESSK